MAENKDKKDKVDVTAPPKRVGPTYDKTTKTWYAPNGKKLPTDKGHYHRKYNKIVVYNNDGTTTDYNVNDYARQFDKYRMKVYENGKEQYIVGSPNNDVFSDDPFNGLFTVLPKRQKENNSSTPFQSSKVEDSLIDKMYKSKNHVYGVTPQFEIPYGNKTIKINGREYSQNALDSTMINAGRAEIPFRDALGINEQESGFGRVPASYSLQYTNDDAKKDIYGNKFTNKSVFNSNVFRNYGIISPQALGNIEFMQGMNPNISPLWLGYDYYARGLYNTGDKVNHTRAVSEKGNKIANSPEFQQYYQDRGKAFYDKGKSQTDYVQEMWNLVPDTYKTYVHKKGTKRNVFYDKKAIGGKNNINTLTPNIIRGGQAIPLGNGFFYMKGRKHEQGGIDVGETLEVEGGEVMENENKSLKIYSAQKILNDDLTPAKTKFGGTISPAEAILAGANPKKTFKGQEQYKDRFNLNDDGTKKKKAELGTEEKDLNSTKKKIIAISYDKEGNIPLNPIKYLYNYINSKAFEDRAKLLKEYSKKYITTARNNINNNIVNLYDFDRDSYSGRILLTKLFGNHFIKRPYNTINTGNQNNPNIDYSNTVGNNIAIDLYDNNEEDNIKSPINLEKTVAHEYAHIIDPTSKNSTNIYDGNDKDRVPELYLNLHNKKKLKDKSNNSHERSYHETYADLQEFRSALFNSGVYDIINDGKFTKEHLDEYRNKKIENNDTTEDRLLNLFDDEVIIKMMNTIAQNNKTNNNDNTYYARYGLNIKQKNKKAMGGKVTDTSTGKRVKAELGKNYYDYYDTLYKAIPESQMQLIDRPSLSATKIDSKDNYNPNKILFMMAKPNSVYNIPKITKNTIKTSFNNEVTRTTPIKSPNTFKSFITNNLNDVIGAGSNLIGSLIGWGANRYHINRMQAPRVPVQVNAKKLKTTFNTRPQIAQTRDAIQAIANDINKNTNSSKVALNRSNLARINGINTLNNIYAQKENTETQLINQDKLNQQSIIGTNVANYNQYLDKLVAHNNNIRNMKSENDQALIAGINSTIQDTLARREKRNYDLTNLALTAAANPNSIEYIRNLLPELKRKQYNTFYI